MKNPYFVTKLSRRERKELALSKVFFISLTVIGLLIVVWLAWVRPASRRKAVNSYASCVAAGNPVEASTPRVCTTPDNRRFSEPAHRSGSQKLTAPIGQQYLKFTQWGVRMPLSVKIIDAYYTADEHGVYLTTKTLENTLQQLQGCTSGLHGLYLERFKVGDPNELGGTWTAQDTDDALAHVGDYYYRQQLRAEPACVTIGNDAQAAVIQDLEQELLAHFRALQSL